MIQRVMLVRHINRPEAQAAAQAAARELSVRDIDVVPEGDCTGDIDLVLATGGDGTILAAAEYARKFDAPLLGINMGHMGFLAEVSADGILSVVDCRWALHHGHAHDARHPCALPRWHRMARLGAERSSRHAHGRGAPGPPGIRSGRTGCIHLRGGRHHLLHTHRLNCIFVLCWRASGMARHGGNHHGSAGRAWPVHAATCCQPFVSAQRQYPRRCVECARSVVRRSASAHRPQRNNHHCHTRMSPRPPAAPR